ncbi:hypothetical protein PCANC_18689 [Puccinia coronata f. sp. avenae]|uniref:Cutinase n=1 Tax=Puccinia coronata f. sp. avenae TaxID=200324 RepID=A0A2N5TYX3_9BASI|nr:hypothetical protein PCANC_18689 [Puccinia coronata f. sp. avenae]
MQQEGSRQEGCWTQSSLVKAPDAGELSLDLPIPELPNRLKRADSRVGSALLLATLPWTFANLTKSHPPSAAEWDLVKLGTFAASISAVSLESQLNSIPTDCHTSTGAAAADAGYTDVVARPKISRNIITATVELIPSLARCLAGLGGASGLGSSLGGGGFGGYGSEEAGGFGTGQGKPLESNGGCPSYYMIGARGTTEGPGGSMAYNTVSEKVMATIPGGARRELDQYSTSADYTMTVTEGSRTEVQMISAEISKCPKTVFVLLGYSKGAMVRTQTLNDKNIPQDKIAAVVLFGNPYFKAGSPQNKCGATTGMGVAAMAGVKMPEQLIDRVYNCCVPHDPICQIDGTIMNHLTYAGQHANDASNFVMIQLKRKLLHKTGHK